MNRRKVWKEPSQQSQQCRWWSRRQLILTTGLVLVTALTTGFSFGGWQNQVRQANENLTEGQVAESIEIYKQALVEEPEEAVIHYNLGHAQYQNQDYAQAKENFGKAMTYSEDEALVNQAEYNLGNVAYREGEAMVQENPKEAMNLYETALHHYQQAIIADSHDQDARYNYEFVQKKLDELKEQIEENQEQSDDQNSDQQQDQQEQQDQKEQDEQKQDEQEQQDKQDEQDQEDKQDKQDQNQQEESDQQQQQDQQDQQNQDQDQQNQSDQDQSQSQQDDQDSQDSQDDQQQQQQQQGEEEENQQNQQAEQQSGQEEQSSASQQEQGTAGEEQQVGLTKQEAIQLLEQFKDQDGEMIPIQPKQYQSDSEDYKDW